MKGIKEIFIKLAIFYLLNYTWIENKIPFVKRLSLINITALVMVIFLLFISHESTRIKQSIEELNILLFFFITVFLGFLGSLLFKIQSVTVTMTDAFLFSRFFIAYVFIKLTFNEMEKNQLFNWLLFNIKIILILNFTFLVFNSVFHVFPTMDIRFGLPSQMLMYPHPTYLGTISFIGLILLDDDRNRFIFQLLAMVLIVSTMRNKVIILMILFLVIRIVLKKRRRFIGEKYFLIIIFSFLLLIVFKDTIFVRLLDKESSARSILLMNSLDILVKYFPFGLGFGTYGSYMSFANYSQIYLSLGINHIYGFLPNSYQYGMDSYISMLFAQFGFLGVICFCIMLFNLIKSTIFVNNKLDVKLIFVFIFLISSSITESVISTGMGMLIFIVIGLLESINKCKMYERKNFYD